MLIKKIIVPMLFSLGVSGNAWSESSNNVYEIKEEFIEKLDDAATVHSREASLRRERLLEIIEKIEAGNDMSKSDKLFMSNLAKRYNANVGDTQSLLLSTDKVPVGIIIAVAIKESNWGSNKEMKEAKNPFGIRCFSVGCGMPDEMSELSEVYSELAVFDNAVESTRAFTKNINLNSQYEDFRKERFGMRERGEYLTSLPLAEYVVPFSIKEEGYGQTIRKLIHENKLYYLDE